MPTLLSESGPTLTSPISPMISPQIAPNAPGGSDAGPTVVLASPSQVIASAPPPAPKPASVSFDFEMTISAAQLAAGIPIQGPNVRILPGQSVQLAPIPSNSGVVRVSNVGRDAANYGPNRKIAVGSIPQTMGVKNLCQLWLYWDAVTVAGDGIAITIREDQ